MAHNYLIFSLRQLYSGRRFIVTYYLSEIIFQKKKEIICELIPHYVVS